MGGKWGKSGKKRREEALDSPTGRTHAPFSLVSAPQAPPRASGSGWVRRHQFRPEPAKNGLLGARLGRFFSVGAAKTPEEVLLGARLEMLLVHHVVALQLYNIRHGELGVDKQSDLTTNIFFCAQTSQ